MTLLQDHTKISTNSQEHGPAGLAFKHLPVTNGRLLPTAAENQKAQGSGKRFSQDTQDYPLPLVLLMPTQLSIF